MNVAEVNADPEHHASIRRKFFVLLCQCLLHGHAGQNSASRRLKYSQNAVAGHIDNAALIGFYVLAKDRAELVQRRDRRPLVIAHQSRIAGDIRRQDSRQSLSHPRLGQGVPPNCPSTGSNRVP
jgi:hypothetical protein